MKNAVGTRRRQQGCGVGGGRGRGRRGGGGGGGGGGRPGGVRGQIVSLKGPRKLLLKNSDGKNYEKKA